MTPSKFHLTLVHLGCSDIRRIRFLSFIASFSLTFGYSVLAGSIGETSRIKEPFSRAFSDNTWDSVNPKLNRAIKEILRQRYPESEKLLQLDSRRDTDSPLQSFLSGLHLHVGAFDSTGTHSQGASLSFGYQFDPDLVLYRSISPNLNIFSINAGLRNFGFRTINADRNPNPFQSHKVRLGILLSKGISNRRQPVYSDSLSTLEYGLATSSETVDSLEPMMTKLVRGPLLDSLPDQAMVDIGIVTGIESDQDFTKSQLTYGIELQTTVKGWASRSKLRHYNVLDFFPALLRYGTGMDDDFTPLGATIPTLVVGVDQVLDSTNTIRHTLAPSDGDFVRAYVGLHFRSPFTTVAGQDVFVDWDARMYRELAPSRNVSAGSLAMHAYSRFRIDLPYSAYASLTLGKLPLDNRSDTTFEVGFRYLF